MSAAGQDLEFQVLEQAAEWYAVLQSGAVAAHELAGWRQWHGASAAHRQAWQRVEAISGGMALVRTEPQAAQASLDAGARLRRRRRALKTMALMAVLGLGGLTASRTATWQGMQAARMADLRTGAGQRRDAVLPDGSRVWLNTATALDPRYGDSLRRLDLHQGEILVETHPDDRTPARPFVVQSAQGRMRALGTRFNVRQLPGRTEVGVLQGRVEVLPASGATGRIIEAGQQARLTAHALEPSEPLQSARTLWSRGILLADQMPLGEVIEELARYRLGHLGCDPAVAHLRVVGGYPLDEPERALRMLQAALPIALRSPLPWWVTVVPRQP